MTIIDAFNLLADLVLELDAPDDKIDLWLNQIYDIRDSYIKTSNLVVN